MERFILVLVLCAVLCRSQFWWMQQAPWKNAVQAQPAEKAADSPNDDACECVKHYQCDKATNRIIDDGSGILDWKQGGNKRRPCQGDELCCRPPLSAVPSEPAVLVSPPNSPKPRALGCGQRMTESQDDSQGTFDWGFKVAGTDEETKTEVGEYPWMLVMYELVGDAPKMHMYKGGASLITPDIALTTAHSLKGVNVDLLIVRAGEWDMTDDNESRTQERQVVAAVKHPSYKTNPPEFDAALLRLIDPFELNNYVNVICLPKVGENFDGETCIGTGWGLDKEDERAQEQPKLRKAEVDIIPTKSCTEMIKREMTRQRYGQAGTFKLGRDSLCAGSKDGVDKLCKGDGGGPLMCKAKDSPARFVQVGITAWGLGGCKVKFLPGVYTNVPNLRGWIDKTIREQFTR